MFGYATFAQSPFAALGGNANNPHTHGYPGHLNGGGGGAGSGGGYSGANGGSGVIIISYSLT